MSTTPTQAGPPKFSRDFPFLPPRTAARWLLVVAALLAVGWLLWNARPALMPFIVGLALAYLLLPLVNWLSRHIPRALAILIVYVIAIAVIIGVIAYLVPVIVTQIQQLIASLPTFSQWQGMVGDLLRQYQSRVPPSIRQPIDETVNNALRTMQANLTTYVQEVSLFIWGQVIQVLNIVSFLVGFFIIPIWLFYVLHDQTKLRMSIDRLLHSRMRADFWNAWDIVNHDLGDYVRGQLTLSLIVGVLVTTGMLIVQLIGLRMNYALLLGIISTLTELIPVIGPTLGMIPGVLIGLLISPLTGLAAFLVYVIIQQFESSFLVPRVLGASIGIHPAVLMMVIIMMGYTFGLIGIILAAPLAAIARDLFIYTYRRLDGRSAQDARAGLIHTLKTAPRKA